MQECREWWSYTILTNHMKVHYRHFFFFSLQAYFRSPYAISFRPDKVSHCFSYLNNFTDFREFILIYTRVMEHKIKQLFFPRRQELTFQFQGKSIAGQVKTLQCLDVNVLYPLHANHTRTEFQMMEIVVASKFHLSYTILMSWRSSQSL